MMHSVRNIAAPQVVLPCVHMIGFCGHRNLENEAALRESIRTLLGDYLSEHPNELYAVSSVAAGADLLFTETCIELGIPLKVLLPLSLEDFESDFDLLTWARARKVMEAAFDIEVIGTQENRTERYYECGVEIVDQSDLMLVVWNGLPAKGFGGTGDIVNFATKIGKPLV